MKSLLLAVLLSFLFVATTRAGDAANLEVIGFSKNGAYVAFEQFGIADGSGHPYSQISIAEVARNELVSRVEATVQDSDKPVKAARDAVRVRARAALVKYGIVSGNQGRFYGLAGRIDLAAQGYQVAYLEVSGRTYTLEATTQDVNPVPEACTTAPQLLRVTLTIGDAEGILQRDARLPAVRQCAYNYEFHSAFVFGRSLAVFLRYDTRGFEGADTRWMVVTTRL
jgi:predicted secreted protein